MLNLSDPAIYPTHRQGAFTSNVKATMHFRRSYTIPTSLIRTQWTRRKHLYGWLHLANVLKLWAQGYRFGKQHLRFNLRQHFSKVTFLAFNLITVKNSISSFYKGTESFTSSPATRKILKIFTHFLNPRYLFLLSLKNVNFTVISLSQNYTQEDDFYLDNRFSTALLRDSLPEFSYPTHLNYQISGYNSSAPALLSSLQQIFSFVLRGSLFIYKILVLLVIYRLRF